jgi:hypothetical protein
VESPKEKLLFHVILNAYWEPLDFELPPAHDRGGSAAWLAQLLLPLMKKLRSREVQLRAPPLGQVPHRGGSCVFDRSGSRRDAAGVGTGADPDRGRT